MNKDLIASIIFATGCFLFFYLAVPQYDKILDIKDAIQNQKKLLDDRTALIGNVKSLTSQYQSRKADIDRLAVLLPEKKQLDQIISGLEATANFSGLQIKEITLGADADVKTPKKVNIKFQLAGNYESLLSFLKEIEKSLRIYDVSEISMSKESSTGNTNANSFALELRMTVYNLK